MAIKKLAHFSPGRIIFYSIFLTIILGTLALALPIARTKEMSVLDLVFTATSTTCVTGLMTVPLDAFTTFGHTIILIMMQIGGLGLITLSIFLMSLFVNFGFATQLMAVKLLEFDSWKNIKSFLGFIIGFTVLVELIGALCTLSVLSHHYPLADACFLSVFHAVSAFCNAGIDLVAGGMPAYNTNYLILLSTSALIMAGSLSFVAWHELYQYITTWHEKKHHIFSLHSKIILYGTLILTLIPTVIIFALEYNHAFAHMSWAESGVNALFQAVAARSAGLLTVPFAALSSATIFLILVLAVIGAAPISTGSGIKITTFAVFISTVKAALFGKTSVEIKKRSIPRDQVYKAIAIVSVALLWMIASLFILLITEKNMSFYSLFVETVSSFATLGISTGITSSLSLIGKLIIIVNMIIGRVGSLTFILALRKAHAGKGEGAEFSYPEERIILG
jgi:trk system potassium uptake protein TrkH